MREDRGQAIAGFFRELWGGKRAPWLIGAGLLLPLLLFALVSIQTPSADERLISIPTADALALARLLEKEGIPHHHEQDGVVAVSSLHYDRVLALIAMHGVEKSDSDFFSEIFSPRKSAATEEERIAKLESILSCLAGVQRAEVSTQLSRSRRVVARAPSTAAVFLQRHEGIASLSPDTVRAAYELTARGLGVPTEKVCVGDQGGVYPFEGAAQSRDRRRAAESRDRVIAFLSGWFDPSDFRVEVEAVSAPGEVPSSSPARDPRPAEVARGGFNEPEQKIGAERAPTPPVPTEPLAGMDRQRITVAISLPALHDAIRGARSSFGGMGAEGSGVSPDETLDSAAVESECRRLETVLGKLFPHEAEVHVAYMPVAPGPEELAAIAPPREGDSRAAALDRRALLLLGVVLLAGAAWATLRARRRRPALPENVLSLQRFLEARAEGASSTTRPREVTRSKAKGNPRVVSGGGAP